MWYCAHGIFYFKVEHQETYLVQENVYLIDAGNEKDALQQAEAICRGNEDLSEDGHLELNGEKAQYLFAGIRKLIEIEHDPETARGHLRSGVEVTYSELEVDTMEEVRGLAKGAFVNVLYRE
ncbi:DUF4288 domain-containing protein [Dyella mobilis]|uniref:DUF4288 domain-containing protein n=1 Tax=Dyella mobilis TaxID=1849582 RepID=A0ABS2KHK2_9GAMM|nr:DUF4288 domain-containing protein [Dyella mobilis]MBM7130652.1 DUF4288 domain-containing protein [Dyella mobilis]GLQ97277.1 hypothetical protein GCM10007863_16970 [Dyella mobilis]